MISIIHVDESLMTLQKSVEWMDKLSSLINPPQVYVCVCVWECACVYAHVCACAHACVCMYACACMYACVIGYYWLNMLYNL